jgi:FkbM family methyltransferase
MQSNLFVANLLKGLKKRIGKSLTSGNKKADLTWIKTKYLKHIPAGKTRSYKYRNKDIVYTSPAELLHTLQEIFVKEIYKANLPSNPFIIDCGANIGLSIIYFKENYAAADILAFEPDEENFLLLQKNTEAFGLKNVTLKKEAVWIKETELNFSNDGTMGSKIQEGMSENVRRVKAVRLKDILNKKVDLLKIDIEGAEFEVLKDIKGELHHVQNMFFEYHGTFEQNNQLTEIFAIVTSAGFNYYIKEAAEIYPSPFLAAKRNKEGDYDVQLNIFCFRRSN